MRYQITASESARKYHYWRGFRSAAIVFVPVIIVLVLACNRIIDALVK